MLYPFRLAISACLALSVAAGASAQDMTRGTPAAEAAVIEKTKEVLRLLDTGDATGAWDGASQLLQKATPRLAFVAGIKAMRGTAGDVEERRLKGIGFSKDMPDAPPGDYSGVFLETKFKRVTVEEKLIFFSQNGQWRLAGYFLSKRNSTSNK